MSTLTVSLTPQQAERMQAAVESGGYASNSEIVRDALRLREQREEIRAVELEQLKRAYAEEKASGEPEEIDPEEFLKELKAERSSRGQMPAFIPRKAENPRDLARHRAT